MNRRLIFIAMLLLATAFSFKMAQAQNWSQVIKACASDRETGDQFGNSVSISGDWAIVGADGEGHDVNGGAYAEGAGAAYIFKNTAGTWQQVQKLVASDGKRYDSFGTSVSISDDYLIVGAAGEGYPTTRWGAAYIFKNNSGTWTQVQKIVASDREADDYFGASVSISGDYAIVGADMEDHDASNGAYVESAGSAYIFKNNEGTWQQVQKIVASDREADDHFGHSVSISGDYAISGAHYDDDDAVGGAYAEHSGSAYLFRNIAGSWQQVKKIVASDREEKDQFGISVSISGIYVLVGAQYEDHDATGGAYALSAGSAYIFKNNAGTWQQVQKIVASDRKVSDYFGWSVDISGDYAIVGAANEGYNTSSGVLVEAVGSAYIFKNNSGTWTQVQEIVASPREAADYFGWSVAISDDYAIAGVPWEGHSNSGGPWHYGSAYIFKNNASSGILNASANGISIYPNPTSGNLTLESGQWTVKNIEITDITGKTIINYQASAKNANLKIDLSGLEHGIYLLRIFTDKEVLTSKIVKE